MARGVRNVNTDRWWLALIVLAAACAPAAGPAAPVTPSPPPRPSPTAAPSAASTTLPTATASPTPLPTPTTGPTPPGGAAELILGIVERIGNQYDYGPILRYQVVEGSSGEITAGGYEFLGLSPSGDRLLARREDHLVLLDLTGAEAADITDKLLITGGRTAVWIPGTESIALVEAGEPTHIVVYDAASRMRRDVAGTDGARELILPSNADRLVWLSEPCGTDGRCETAASVDLIGGGVEPLPDLLRPSFDPTGRYAAFLYEDDEQRKRLALSPTDRSRIVRPGVPGDNILDFVWSPDGSQLLVVALVRSDYSGRWFGARQFLITPGTWDLRELPQTETANALGLWSPDGHAVVLAGTQPDPSGYVVTLRRIDVDSRKIEILQPGVSLSRPNYVFVSMMAWRPLR